MSQCLPEEIVPFLLRLLKKSITNKSSKAKLNLSFQEGIPPGKNLNEKFDFMEKHGVVGFEPGGRGLAKRIPEFKNALKGRNIKISAICAGFDGFILSSDPAIRKQCRDTMTKSSSPQASGIYRCNYGAGLQFTKPVMPHTQETRDFLCEQLNEMGNFAREPAQRLFLNPQPTRGFYLRLVADAASICRDIDNPGIKCMGDFWHMTWEETSDMGHLFPAENTCNTYMWQAENAAVCRRRRRSR